MDHKEERKREELEWNWLLQNVVEPIKKLDNDSLWSEDDIQISNDNLLDYLGKKVKPHIYGFT